MGSPMMAQRQRENLNSQRGRPLRRALRANQKRLCAVGGAFQNARDLAHVVFVPKVEKGSSPQFAAEHRIGATADDPEWETILEREFEDAGVGQHAPDCAGFDIVALRRATRAAQSVPIGEKLLAGSKLQDVPRFLAPPVPE